jgi:hypothetical protein
MKTDGPITQLSSLAARELIDMVLQDLPNDDEPTTREDIADIMLGVLIMFRLVEVVECSEQEEAP